MKEYEVLDLEYGYPPVLEAMNTLKYQLTLYRKCNIKCILIIHGYGSSGEGGKIRSRVRKYLESELKNGTIKKVVYGERFDIFNGDARDLKSRFKQLEGLSKQNNHGVTVVEL